MNWMNWYILLDRVFQPIANRIHRLTGLWPSNLAEIFIILSVLAMAYRYHYDHPPPYTFDLNFGLGVMRQLCLPILMSIFILYPKHSGNGPNPKRVSLLALRICFLAVTIYFLINIGLAFITGWGWTTTFSFGLPAEELTNFGAYAYTACAAFIWWAASFASLQTPPRRTVRVSKGYEAA